MKICKLLANCVIALFLITVSSILSQEKEDTKWEELRAVTSRNLKKVFFIDKENGWIVGPGIILKTTDGGRSWQIVKEGKVGDVGYFKSVYFKDKLKGWIVGGHSYAESSFPPIVMKTEDGGKTWTNIEEMEKDAKRFYYINFKGETGWVMGSSFSYRTEDGGVTWKKLDTKKGIGWFFINEKVGFSIVNAELIKTKDGGKTWEEKDISEFLPKDGLLLGEFFFNEKVGIATGGVNDDTLIVKTEDGGKTWIELAQIKEGGFARKVYFADEQNGWIITKRHPEEIWSILHTEDGGKTWDLQVREKKVISHFFFIDKEHAIAVGASGLILRYAPKNEK